MQLEHSFTVPVGVEDAWRVLLDIERVAPCMPGAAIDSVNGDDFTGTVKVKLGPIGLTYKGKASFIDKDEVAHKVTINAQGRDSRGNGTAAAKVTATLTETDGQTKVDVITDLDITGKPAQFGRGVMVDVGNKLIGQFADCLAGKLAEGDVPIAGEPVVAPVVAPAAKLHAEEPSADAPATAPAAAPAAAPAKKTTAAKTTPAKKTAPVKSTPAPDATLHGVAPAAKLHAEEPQLATAPAMSVPATSVPATSRNVAPADVEPINLIESAGPAVAKRLVPVVIGAVALVVIVRHLRKR
jgi:carbon monoxide dehydrogenase subunit G